MSPAWSCRSTAAWPWGWATSPMVDPRQVAARLRLLADHLVTDELTADGWSGLDDALARILEGLPGDGTGPTRFATGFAADPSPDEIHQPTHSLGQGASGVFPPMRLEFSEDGERLLAHTRFGPAWEGPPGLVHGGFLAAGFDMVISALAAHVLDHSVTRSLRLRFLKPTVLGAALRYDVGVVGDRDGRLVDLQGTLYADDRVTMRATAQFAAVDATRFGHQPPPATI